MTIHWTCGYPIFGQPPHCKVNSSIVKHFNSKVFGIPKTTSFSNLNFRIPMISHVISHLLMIFLKKPGSQRQAVQETEERCFNRWWMPKIVKTETKNTRTTINLLWSCRFFSISSTIIGRYLNSETPRQMAEISLMRNGRCSQPQEVRISCCMSKIE